MSANGNGVVLLLVGAAVGIALWIITRPKPQHSPHKNVENSPLEKIYDKVTKTPLPDLAVARRPRAARKILETPPTPPPTFYTQDHYDGPMGVPVPEGVLRDYASAGGLRADLRSYPNYPYPLTGGGGPGVISSSQFVGSTYFGPAPPVDTTWVKLGILVNDVSANTGRPKDQKILDLYGREIAPAQELYQYQVKDKNGFFIPLNQNWYLEDGDVINNIPGKPGRWRIVNEKRYVWV